ncbi:MAG: deoxyribonuclease IV [Chitinispirillaceae bacterium]|nr:deoxyribonuclease IV [Chitinispirillaceae bacterium]
MKYIGPHVSISGGVQNAPQNAFALGATAFGMFTKNQRQWSAPPYDEATVAAFKKNLLDRGYTTLQVLPHNTYLINLGNPDPAAFKKSYAAFVDELKRCGRLGLTMLNIHPGSHLLLISEEACMERIAESINAAHGETSGVTVVLENTAGQGSNVGYSFEHLAFMIDHVSDKSRIGFCFDTCHAFAAGYDLRTKNAWNDTMKRLDDIVGFGYLRAAHVNDAKAELGSRLDRHQSIGKGTLGLDAFKMLMNDERFERIPLVLETIDESLWPAEIALLRGMAGG